MKKSSGIAPMLTSKSKSDECVGREDSRWRLDDLANAEGWTWNLRMNVLPAGGGLHDLCR